MKLDNVGVQVSMMGIQERIRCPRYTTMDVQEYIQKCMKLDTREIIYEVVNKIFNKMKSS